MHARLARLESELAADRAMIGALGTEISKRFSQFIGRASKALAEK